jgi:hypothetical protein
MTRYTYYYIERFDQGHLLSKLEVPRVQDGNRILSSAVGGELSRKEPFEQLINIHSEHLHMSPRQLHNICVKDSIINLKNCNQREVKWKV